MSMTNSNFYTKYSSEFELRKSRIFQICVFQILVQKFGRENLFSSSPIIWSRQLEKPNICKINIKNELFRIFSVPQLKQTCNLFFSFLFQIKAEIICAECEVVVCRICQMIQIVQPMDIQIFHLVLIHGSENRCLDLIKRSIIRHRIVNNPPVNWIIVPPPQINKSPRSNSRYNTCIEIDINGVRNLNNIRFLCIRHWVHYLYFNQSFHNQLQLQWK